MFRWRPLQQNLRILRNQPQYRSYRIGPGPRQQYRRFESASNFLLRWAAKPTFYRDIGLITVGTGGFYVYNLEEVPISGRRRFNIISPSIEASIGASTVDQIKQEFHGQFLPEYDPRFQQVKRVLERLLPYVQGAGLENVQWEINVIDSPEQNAFVVPGGKVFVFTGILPLCKDEDGIAAVLGHEIAHVVAHHTAESLSRAPIVLLASLGLLFFDVSFQLSKFVFDLFLTLPNSRKHEAEADYIGLMMMAQGCYRPEAAMELWNRMEQSGQRAPPQVLSTHPSNHNREGKIREWLPKAHEIQENSECQGMMSYANQFSAAFRNQSRW